MQFKDIHIDIREFLRLSMHGLVVVSRSRASIKYVPYFRPLTLLSPYFWRPSYLFHTLKYVFFYNIEDSSLTSTTLPPWHVISKYHKKLQNILKCEIAS